MKFIRWPCIAIVVLAFIGAASPQNDRPISDNQPAFTDSQLDKMKTAIMNDQRGDIIYGDNRVDVDLLYQNHPCGAANLLTIATVDDFEAARPIPAIMIAGSTTPPPFDEMTSLMPVYKDMLENYGPYGQEGRSADATMAALYAANAPRRHTYHRLYKQPRYGKRLHHRT